MVFTNFPNKTKLQKLPAMLYTAWVGFWFVLIFLCLFPLFYIFLQKEEWKRYAHELNRIWAKILFPIIGMEVEVRHDFTPDFKTAYVFVANHFSYWDIASMGAIVDNYYAFVGKSSVKKIPLLGYMFAKLHIQVDRSDKESRAKSMTRAMRAIEKGRSMMMFAEGGIVTRNPPQMATPLKDGAFLMAIQNQVPIVPVTLLNNHQIIWDEDLLMRRLPVKAVIHQPISTIGLKTSNMDELKEKTYQIIQNELNKYHGIVVENSLGKTTKLI
jgi:1-acyl-sn-glycerol-3-phosphate acyltransferase